MVKIFAEIALNEGFIGTPALALFAYLNFLSGADEFLLVCEFELSFYLVDESVDVFYVLF